MTNLTLFALETSMKDQIGETFAERAGVAGSVTLLGMVTIFAVLALLWGVIEILHRLLYREEKTETPKTTEPAPRKAEPAVRAEQKAVSTPAAKAEDNGELIAVITAAIAEAMKEEGYTGGFRVVSFRRTQNRKSGR